MPDRFWRDTLADLDRIPAEAVWRPDDDESTSDVLVYDVRFRGWGGARIAAWYALPRHPGTAKLPGLLVAPGYLADPAVPVEWAERGYAVLSLAYRGKNRANADVAPGFPGYVTSGIEDAHTYVYRGVYADGVRGLDLLRSRREVDADRVGVRAVSQGAAIVLAAAALRPGAVAAVAVGCPFLTGIDVALAEATAGPYEEIRALLSSRPELGERVRRSLGEVDVLNLAAEVRAPVYLHVGTHDTTCPPTTAGRLGQVLPGPVTVDEYPDCGHEAGARWADDKAAVFLAKHLEPRSPVPAPGGPTSCRVPPAVLDGRERERYFDQIDEELARLPRAIQREPLDTSGAYDRYRLRFTGTDDARLSALLTVPHGTAHTAVIFTPRYGTVNFTPGRAVLEEFVTLTINHRGQDLTSPETPMPYPGALRSARLGPEKFLYRHVFADTLRGIDIALDLPDLDRLARAVVGDDLAVLAAARRPVFGCVRVDRLLLTSATHLAREFSGVEDRQELARTLAVFDVPAAAGEVEVPLLVALSAQEEASFPATGRPGLTVLQLTHREAIDEPEQWRWLREASRSR
ncbi:acetylxylan esterase [Amycolatopsis sp. cg9]|uniref:acetylxylan esterase n=1 Tax=Amycolatopsis sp. cg9 TaxID=3238801 RepID=UPI003526952D